MNALFEKLIIGLLIPALVAVASVVGGWTYLREDVTKQDKRIQIIEAGALVRAESDGRIKATLEQVQKDVSEIKEMVRSQNK